MKITITITITTTVCIIVTFVIEEFEKFVTYGVFSTLFFFFVIHSLFPLFDD